MFRWVGPQPMVFHTYAHLPNDEQLLCSEYLNASEVTALTRDSYQIPTLLWGLNPKFDYLILYFYTETFWQSLGELV